jgi:putative transposase
MKNSSSSSRKSIRLSGYDYSLPGAYFITIMTFHRECIFGDVNNQRMIINQYGQIVDRTWHELTNHYPNINLDAYIIMPNHFHGIVLIEDDTTIKNASPASDMQGISTINEQRKTLENPDTFRENGNRIVDEMRTNSHDLSEIIRAFKSFSAKKINILRGSQGFPVWQRSFYDRVIRDENEYQKIYDYIQTNPQNWLEDQLG